MLLSSVKILAKVLNSKFEIRKHHHRFLSAFTLVEMIIVLGIIGVMMNLSFGTAYSTISTQQMVQSARTLIQDMRLARIQAMNLQRAPTDKWVHGVGLDISELDAKGRYVVFQLLDGPPASTQGRTSFVPFPTTPLFNGYTENAPGNVILGSPLTGRMKAFPEKYPVIMTINRSASTITRLCDNDPNKKIELILFQSLSGRVRLYRKVAGSNPYQEISGCNEAVILLRANNVAEYKITINRTKGDDIYMESKSL